MKMILAQGSADLKKYREGKIKKLSYKKSVLAKCNDCMCNYADGRQDCEIPLCPLYPYMPYKGKHLKDQQEG